MTRLVVNAELADQLRRIWSRDDEVELVDQNGERLGILQSEFEYRPLPPFGTPEFDQEIERRRRNPGRLRTVEESLADWNVSD